MVFSADGILTIFSNGSVPLNKMTAMPIYGKTFKNLFFSKTKKALRLSLGIHHQGLIVYKNG